jgi:hypothetical protein
LASTVLDPIAEALRAELAAVGVAPVIKAHKWAPRALDKVPAGVIGVPSLRRREPDGAESRLGRNDWRLIYPVGLYFELTEAIAAQARAVEVLEAWVKAIDANDTLNDLVEDAAVTVAEPDFTEEGRPMVLYLTEVHMLAFVP